MRIKFHALLLCAGLTIAVALQDSLHGFGTGVATRPGKFVPISAKHAAVEPPGGGGDFVAIGGGKDLYLALRYDGSVIAWGIDRYGGVRNQPKGNNFIGIACGMDHCLAMKSDGSLVAWGGCEVLSKEVVSVPKGNDFQDLTAGGGHSAIIHNDGVLPGQGSIYCWGRVPNSVTPPGKDFVSVKGGNKHFIALRANGTAAGFGSNNYGQSASAALAKDLIAVGGGGYRNLGLKADRSLLLFPPREEPPAGKDFIGLCGSYGGYDMFIRANGSLAMYGLRRVPAPPALKGNNFVAVSTGYYVSMALESAPDKPLPKPTVHTFAAPSHELVVHRAMDTGPELAIKYTLNGKEGSVKIPKGMCSAVVKADAGATIKLVADDKYKVGSPAEAKNDKGGKPNPPSFWYRKIGPLAGPFAQEMKAYRAIAQLSQAEFAAKLKVDVATIQQWEAGWWRPLAAQEVMKQARALAPQK